MSNEDQTGDVNVIATNVNINSYLPSNEVPSLTLVVVRHGLTAWNAEGRLQGQVDIPLCEEGRWQASRLGNRLERAWSTDMAGFPGPPDAVFVSDLSRASETASLLFSKISPKPSVFVTPLLRDRGFGAWEGLTASEAQERFGNERSYQSEGESHQAVWDRMEEALEQIWDKVARFDGKSGVAMVVGHGGSLRQLVCLSVGLGIDAARCFRLGNTGLSILELSGSSLQQSKGRIALWNDTAHLHSSPD